MNRQFIERHRWTPSALTFMARALLPSPGLARDGAVPSIVSFGLSLDGNSRTALLGQWQAVDGAEAGDAA